MSDHPGIPAITVFPPFNPAARQAEPAPEPVREPAPPAAHPETMTEEDTQPRASGWDAAAPAAPMPWDFEAPAAADEPAAPAGQGTGVGDEEDDLPWLEVPTPEAEEGRAEEIKAEEAPNWMDWVRTEEAGTPSEPVDEAVTPVEELVEDAQPWAPEVETAADAWQPAAEPADEPWKAPEGDAAGEPWQAPETPAARDDTWREPDFHLTQPSAAEPEAEGEFDLPEPELYGLPEVSPSAAAPSDVPAAEAAEGPEAEPAWELPAADAHPGSDVPPAWESFGAAGAGVEPETAWAAPEAVNEPSPAAQPPASADASGAFAAVADRLQSIADALRSDPGAFLAGAQGGGDPLGLLVAGFVLGYNARQGGGS